MTIERIKTLLAGMGAGLLIAVFHLRGTGLGIDTLDHLRDGALVIVLVCIGLSFWQMKSAASRRLF